MTIKLTLKPTKTTAATKSWLTKNQELVEKQKAEFSALNKALLDLGLSYKGVEFDACVWEVIERPAGNKMTGIQYKEKVLAIAKKFGFVKKSSGYFINKKLGTALSVEDEDASSGNLIDVIWGSSE